MYFKQFFKHILLVVLLSQAVCASLIKRDTWVPIMLSDIITFVPHTVILQDKDGDGIEDALDTPTAYAQDITIDMDSDGYSIVLNGTDNDNAITYTIVTQPAHGVLSGTAPNLTYTPNNGFSGDDSFTFSVNDGDHESEVVTVHLTVVSPVNYGEDGTHPTAHHDEIDGNMTTVYYPTDIPEGTKVPVVFFASGFGSDDAKDYETLLTFIASHGYYVIYAKHAWDNVFANMDKMLDNTNAILPKLDTTRIGVVGHSLGGGYTFNILKYFSDKGYGENGRFIMVLEGYYAYNLSKEEMQNLPSNTNVVMQQYGIGGNNAINDTDPRITLTEYYLLDSIANNKKDWQIVENADHHYPYGSAEYSTMQGILNPLDALMEYTFNETPSAHDIALEQGNDDPYAKGHGIQVVNPTADYGYKCSDNTSFNIRYCDMRQFLYIETNASITKQDYNTTYNEPNFFTKVTRITDRSVQTRNMHPYPKQGGAWNSDMSIIMLGYRLYDAQTFSELGVTAGLDGSGAYAKLGSPWQGAADLRWSKNDPKKLYVIDSSQRFKEVIINANNTDIENYNILIDMSTQGYTSISTGNNEGNLDYNDTHIIFAAKKDADNQVYALKYKLSENTLAWQKPVPHALWGEGFDWITVDPKVEHIVVSTDAKMYVYDMDLNNEELLVDRAEHGDIGINDRGETVYVQMKSGGRGIWSYNLSTLEAIKLIDSNHGGGHVSCRNTKRPGWCYVSTAEEGYKEVFGVKLDNGSGVTERFSQTHMSEQNGGCTQVNVSPDGKQVLFASDWNEGDAADYQWDADNNMSCTDDNRHIKIDTYLVEFP